MKPGPLMILAGLLPVKEVPEDAREALAGAAYAFLAAGGRVTLSEWAAMSSPEQDAFSAAYATLRQDQAQAVADALESLVQEAGEEAIMEGMIEQAMENAGA